MFSTVYRIWDIYGVVCVSAGVMFVWWGGSGVMGYSCLLHMQGCVLYMCGGVVWLSGWR